MTSRLLPLAGLLLIVSAASAAPAPTKDKSKVYKTPQEVFDAWQAAGDKDDYKTMAALMAPEAQKDAAALLAVQLAPMRAQLEDSEEKAAQDALKKFKPLFDVMDKHGLTIKVLREVQRSTAQEDLETSKKVWARVIKDAKAFLVDVLTAAVKLSLGGEKPKVKEKLTDLKIDGDKAEGTLVRTTVGKDEKEKVKKEPVKFVKINGSWRIIPSMGLDEGKEE
jgi:hypothetical protein